MINRPTSAGSAPSTDSHRLSLVWPGSAWCDPAGLARPATAGSATPADSRPFIGVRRWSCTTRCGSGCLIGRRVTGGHSSRTIVTDHWGTLNAAVDLGRRDVEGVADNFLGWGVVVPLYAVAILTTRVLPRWIGWLGLLVGALAGWGCSARHRR